MDSTVLKILAIDTALLIIIGLILFSNHKAYEERLQICMVQCRYDYTKPTMRPIPGTYQTCVDGCNAQD